MTANRSRKIRRTRADRLLSAVVEVAKDINSDTHMSHYVRKLSVFGCYLGTGSVLNSLSIAYDLGTRRKADARNAELIVACLKLRPGISLCPHAELHEVTQPHRIVFESAEGGDLA